MNKMGIIIGFMFKNKVKMKLFVVMIIVFVFLILIGFNVFYFIILFNGGFIGGGVVGEYFVNIGFLSVG